MCVCVCVCVSVCECVCVENKVYHELVFIQEIGFFFTE